MTANPCLAVLCCNLELKPVEWCEHERCCYAHVRRREVDRQEREEKDRRRQSALNPHQTDSEEETP